MVFLLGREGSQASTFAGKLAIEMRTSLRVLNEVVFEAMLPRLDKTAPIVIEKGFTAGSHHERLLKTIKKRDISVIMVNCDAGDLHGYAAVSPKGNYVAVKSVSNGRRQELLVISTDEAVVHSSMECIERKAKEDDSTRPAEPKDDHKQAELKESTSGKNEIARLAQFLRSRDERIKNVQQQQHYYWEQLSTVHFEQYVLNQPTTSSGPDWLNDQLKKGFLKAFFSVDVSLYATKTPRQKWIKFQLTDAAGVTVKMTQDDGWAKGWFNHYADIYLFPGGGSDPHHSTMPPNWTRPNIQPHTPNSQTTYTDTTGWSFGVSAGVDPSGPNANVTAAYSQSSQTQKTINDFSVRNRSDQSMTGWEFYYTAVDGDSWKDHFTWNNAPLPIADLAKSTLTLNSEGVYRGPPDGSERIPWSFKFHPVWGVLRGNLEKIWIYRRWTDFNNFASIDMGAIQNPEP